MQVSQRSQDDGTENDRTPHTLERKARVCGKQYELVHQ